VLYPRKKRREIGQGGAGAVGEGAEEVVIAHETAQSDS
jgi:hypothetical protein